MNISPYLHYYLGCKVQYLDLPDTTVRYGTLMQPPITGTEWSIRDEEDEAVYFSCQPDIKPILRSISSLTDDEKLTLNVTQDEISFNEHDTIFINSFNSMHYLLSIGIWLFGDEAFTDGSIIDADSFKNTTL